MKSISTLLLLLAAVSMLAAEPPKKPADFKGEATMCESRYALCIKARCAPDKSGDKTHVKCECVMENGWNMGPNSCEDRRVHLTSTYSNKFNVGSRVLTCPKPINWAWCYGAACQKDEKDPKGALAICTCPVINNTGSILVDKDKCKEPAKVCSETWSAAYPKESEFANHYYAWWMQSHGFPTEPPAEACLPTK